MLRPLFSRFAVPLLAGLFALPMLAVAAEDEIQVYTEEMDEPGEFGVELHVNYVQQGRKTAGYPGEMRSQGRLQLTPEFSYGLTKQLEAGLYLPFAREADGGLYGNGVRLRLKFIAPRERDEGFFWGLNGEFGHANKRVSESRLGLEFRPIIGYRDAQWLLSFNPILNTDLQGSAARRPQFEPALKLTHRVAEGWRAGVEYYGEYGPLDNLLPESQRAHYLYGVIDAETRGFDLNFGIGRGMTAAEDRWVFKAIIALPL